MLTPSRMHGFWVFALWVFTIYWLYTFQRLVRNIPRLRTMRDFYEHLLDIPDQDIQTIQWQQIVGRIMVLRDHNLTTAPNLSAKARKLLDSKSRQRLDAVDIASRLMRRDNYLIALFNKEILDVSINVPFLGNRTVFSETTSWHVNLAIMDFVFSGPNGQFNQDFLKERNRRALVDKLKTRLLWTGIISVVCAPFAVTFILASYLFKYFSVSCTPPSRELRLTRLGIPQRSLPAQHSRLYNLCPVEIPRVQRASPSLLSPQEYGISLCQHLSRPIPQR